MLATALATDPDELTLPILLLASGTRALQSPAEATLKQGLRIGLCCIGGAAPANEAAMPAPTTGGVEPGCPQHLHCWFLGAAAAVLTTAWTPAGTVAVENSLTVEITGQLPGGNEATALASAGGSGLAIDEERLWPHLEQRF